MSSEKQYEGKYVLLCDDCGVEALETEEKKIGFANQVGRINGWQIAGFDCKNRRPTRFEHYCPACKRARNAHVKKTI